MNADKLAKVVELLAQVRTVLDGGYHYSSPFLRSRGDGPQLAPPILREKPDALSLLADVVEDLTFLSSALTELDDQAKGLEIDTKAMCETDLGLYQRTYEQLAIAVASAVQTAVAALSGNGESNGKPERRRATRTPRANKQTSLLESQPPNAAEVQDAAGTIPASEFD